MMEVDTPPAQDSPKHILNALNDDCLQLVLRRLDNIREFQSAAETCGRFQENAKLIFRSCYKNVRLGEFTRDILSNKHTVVHNEHSFLKIFGHLITDLDYEGDITNDVTNMIADNCGKTLKRFKCSGIMSTRFPVIDFSTRSPFQVLEELEVHNTIVNNFKYYSQLKTLRIIRANNDRMNFDWLIETFPKLQFLILSFLCKLQYNEAVDFIKLNPQLKSLRIICCPHIKSEIFQDIANLLPNLEEFGFMPSSGQIKHLSNQWIHISKLPNLKSLHIANTFGIISMGNLVDSLIENNVPIENLFLFINNFNSSDGLNISQLKLLKKLSIKQTTNAILIDYVKNLPNLKLLVCDDSNITVNGIKAALEHGKSLSVLEVQVLDKTTIDLDDYTSVLKLAKLRGVKVKIYIGFNGTIDVPTELMRGNRKWLCVEIGRMFVGGCQVWNSID